MPIHKGVATPLWIEPQS